MEAAAWLVGGGPAQAGRDGGGGGGGVVPPVVALRAIFCLLITTVTGPAGPNLHLIIPAVRSIPTSPLSVTSKRYCKTCHK